MTRGSLTLLAILVAGCSSDTTAEDDADRGLPTPDIGISADMARVDRDAAPPSDGTVDAAPDLDAGRDATRDAGRPDLGRDAVARTPDAAPPLDCQPIANAGHQICEAGPDRCEAVFTDGAGCAAVCALAGLVCLEVHENLDDACGADRARPALACAPASGHQSDHCICGRPDGPPPPDAGLPGDSGMEPPVGDRFESLLAERMGFGRTAGGGDRDRLYRVTTLDDAGRGSLRAALEDETPWWIVFEVDGRIDWRSEVRLGGPKTVDGRGRDITVDGTWRIQSIRDVIISDIAMTRSIRRDEEACQQDGDGILIRGAGGDDPGDFETSDIWIHHCEMFDGGDGLLDIRGGTHITVSWTHFHTHRKVTLAWEDRNGRPARGMHVTWHHNFFDATTVRTPRFHFGKAHLFNNVWRHWWQYAASSYDGAEMLLQNNVFEPADSCIGICVDQNPCGDDNDLFVDRQRAVVTEDEGPAPGFARSEGDLLLGEARIEGNQPERVFDATDFYEYRLEPADAQLAERVRMQAGPRR